jgi:hypothetical protein
MLNRCVNIFHWLCLHSHEAFLTSVFTCSKSIEFGHLWRHVCIGRSSTKVKMSYSITILCVWVVANHSLNQLRHFFISQLRRQFKWSGKIKNISQFTTWKARQVSCCICYDWTGWMRNNSKEDRLLLVRVLMVCLVHEKAYSFWNILGLIFNYPRRESWCLVNEIKSISLHT